MHYKALTPSPYLAAADFGGPKVPREATFTILGHDFNELPSMKPGAKMTDKEEKGLLRLDGPGAKPWIANKTNMALIAAMFGDDDDAWVGHKITLHAVLDSVGAKEELAIRVMGSPDLDRARDVEIKFRGRRAKTYRLVPTGGQPGKPSGKTDLNAALVKLGLAPTDVIAWAKAVAPDSDINAEASDWIRDLTDPSGAARQDYARWLDARGAPASPRDAFLAALPQIGLTADVVTEWLASIGLTPASADDYRAVYATLKPDGTRRAAVDAFIAGRAEGGGAK